MQRENWTQFLAELAKKKVLRAPHPIYRILLWGPPGTGKSSWASRTYGRANVERLTLHREVLPDDLVGTMHLEAVDGTTVTQWRDGPAVRAMSSGGVLVLDEVDQHSGEVRCLLHSLLDDLDLCQVTLPDGRIVRPSPGYLVVGTTNAEPSKLSAPLLDRFDLVLHCARPAEGAQECLDQAEQELLRTHYEREHASVSTWSTTMGVRGMLRFKALQSHLGPEEAANLVFGNEATDLLAALAVAQQAKKKP